MAFQFHQVKGILWKNFLIGQRSKEFLRELISVAILGGLICTMEHLDPNNLFTPFYVSMTIIGYTRSVVFLWVSEKQSFQRQMQSIMGVSFFTYFLSWILYFLLNALYVCLFILLILKFGVLLPNKDYTNFADGYSFIHIVLLLVIYSISLIGFMLLLSLLFSKVKTAVQVTVFIQVLINFLYFFREYEDFAKNRGLILLSSIFPNLSFQFGLSMIVFNEHLNPNFDYTYEDAIIALSLSSVIYLVLAIYLEQVLPNEKGTNKHPLFFLKNLFKKDVQVEKESLLGQERENSAEFYQPRRDDLSPMIKLTQLRKQYGSKVVVDNVTMGFYPNQIFCLLGHNGAGKSTTINLMTGLQKPTKGKLQILGLNFNQNKDQIRRNIGLCLQFNVLYEDFTIEEHLKFYAILKGVPEEKIAQNVEDTIIECALGTQKGKFVKNLSGGNKRKVSLANALIGKSKIIFLDEPSSGLDPKSRQGIWNIIKSVKSADRCLILTTHHLEEAEELSQSIGIMSEGKIAIIGSSDFIKEKFNVGFQIILSFNEQNKELINECRKIIKQAIPSAKEDEQTAKNTLKFILNSSETEIFGKLFEKLEQKAQLSVHASSLEDAFIKLGQEASGVTQDESVNDVQLQLPNIECSYSFSKQFKAVFYRKAVVTFRSMSTIISIAFPVTFMLIGVLMAIWIFPQNSPKQIKMYSLTSMIIMAFVFNTSSYCGDLVLERQKRFKYLSHVLGLQKLPYWLARYAFDFLIFTIPLSVFFIVAFASGEKANFLTDVTGYLLLLFLVFSFSFIGFAYAFSFMFQKASSAYRFFPFINFLFFYTLPLILTSWSQNKFLTHYVAPIFSPFMALHEGLMSRQIMDSYQSSNGLKALPSDYDIYTICGILIGQALLYPVIVYCLESMRFKLKDRLFIDQQTHQQNQASFYDAQNINRNDEIFIDHLYKKYGNGYMAIRDNSFSVKKGQIFGLLGPNGAGKSTTFNIVTAALPKTSGTVNILGQDINSGIMSIFSEFGVCPQYDSIYENMTTEEHLYYFARVKGIPEHEIDGVLKYYYNLLTLTPYIKVKAGNLSGGNKRKLCVSMAMLANPKIMFFDEPSSGVDPISRRFLWKSLTLSARTKQATMILTTHTMNEAESLCSRIGILIKGQFVTVATPAELKRKYGKGFRVNVKCEPEKEGEITQMIKNEFGDKVGIQKLENNDTIVFTIKNKKFKYSKAYNLFDNQLLKLQKINRYQIKQSTLEQVFLFLSQAQPEVEDSSNLKEPWQFCCWECGAEGCQLIS